MFTCFNGDYNLHVRSLFLLLVLSITVSRPASANPVSFKGGYGVMPAYNDDWSDLQVNYSVTNRYSLGISSFYREGKDSTATFGLGQFNYLLKRWNELDSQANVNLSLGLGGRHDSRDDGALAGYGALEADYETRRLYTQLSAETLQSEGSVQFNRIRGRIGFTPYVAPFDALQTWVVLQVDEMPEMDESSRVTPLLRFFYNNFVLEVGASLEGTPFLAGAAHF
jgi:hypothetical protein